LGSGQPAGDLPIRQHGKIQELTNPECR
jgi:hypothetical protein